MMVRMKILVPNENIRKKLSSIQNRIIILMTNEFGGSIIFLTLVILMGLEFDYCQFHPLGLTS
jgi:hypothetical protein